jgi:transposase
MRKNVIRIRWSEEQLTYLKVEYLQGSPLKKIATKLNRSVSAINKVLARHNLRTHSKLERFPTLPRPTLQQIQQKRRLGTLIRQKNMQNNRNSLRESFYRQEVPFERVVYWLQTQRIYVFKSPADVYYEMDGKPKNKQQILYQANLLREQLHLPIFWVNDVTFS